MGRVRRHLAVALEAAVFGAGAAELAEGDRVAAGFGEEVAAVAEHVRPQPQPRIAAWPARSRAARRWRSCACGGRSSAARRSRRRCGSGCRAGRARRRSWWRTWRCSWLPPRRRAAARRRRTGWRQMGSALVWRPKPSRTRGRPGPVGASMRTARAARVMASHKQRGGVPGRGRGVAGAGGVEADHGVEVDDAACLVFGDLDVADAQVGAQPLAGDAGEPGQVPGQVGGEPLEQRARRGS